MVLQDLRVRQVLVPSVIQALLEPMEIMGQQEQVDLLAQPVLAAGPRDPLVRQVTPVRQEQVEVLRERPVQLVRTD